MSTFKFTTITRCGRTNVIVQTANTLWEAKDKYFKHNQLKHTPMRLIKIEFKVNETWFRV